MKHKSNSSEKFSLANDIVLDKNESANHWRAKWVNGDLTYPKDKPYTKMDEVNVMAHKINEVVFNKEGSKNPWRAKWVNGKLTYPKD